MPPRASSTSFPRRVESQRHRPRLRRHRRVLQRPRRSPTAATTCTSTRRSTGCSTSSTARRWASTAWCSSTSSTPRRRSASAPSPVTTTTSTTAPTCPSARTDLLLERPAPGGGALRLVDRHQHRHPPAWPPSATPGGPTRHLTITPALSWVWAYGSNSAGGQAIDSKAWAPSATVAWDATHDGRTVVRGGYSQYVDVAIRTPVAPHPGRPGQPALPVERRHRRRSIASAPTAVVAAATPSGCPAARPASNVDGSPCRRAADDPPDLRVHHGRRARDHPRASPSALDVVYRQFKQPVRAARDQPDLGRLGHPGHRLPQRPQRDGHRHGHARRRQPVLPGHHRRRSTSARAAAGCTCRTPSASCAARCSTAPTTPGATSPAGTSTWTARCPTIACTTSRRRAPTRSPTACRWACATASRSGFPYNRLFRNDVTNAYENRRSLRGHQPGHQPQRPDRRPGAAAAGAAGAERAGRA